MKSAISVISLALALLCLIPLEVTAQPSKIEFTVSPGCGGPGTPVNIAAESAIGGQFYKYWVNTVPWCQPGTANWQVIQEWSTAKTATWLLDQPGVHTFVVWVSNVASDQACEHGQIGATYDVGGASCSDPVEVTLTPPSASINQPVTVTAQASGTDLRYKFWVNTVDFCDTAQSPNWVVLQDWSTANAVTYTPPAPGFYTLIAWALPATDLNNSCPPQGGMVYEVHDGAALYAQNCASCHGALATSSKRGATASRTQDAINNNVGGMGSPTLRSLTPAQVQAIATALAP